MTDHDLQILEGKFPAVSGKAFAAARERVLASGQSVLQSKDGVIYQVFPDGKRVALEKIAPPTRAVPGSTLSLR